VLGAFTEIGFVYLSNHGISQELIEKTFEMSKAFFRLDLEAKQKLAWTTAESNRGYVSQGREKVRAVTHRRPPLKSTRTKWTN
jgi:isopenicillin N synthase-like dioxygenase